MDPSACHHDGLYSYGSSIRFVGDLEPGVIHDDEPDEDDEAKEYARSTADEYTGSSAESSSKQPSKYKCDTVIEPFSNQDPDNHIFPIISVSSVFSDSSEDDVCECDIAPSTVSEVDDICVTLHFAPTNIQECIMFTEKTEATICSIPTTIEGGHITSTCLDIVSSTETTEIIDDTSTSAADHEIVLEGLVSDNDTKSITITFSSPTEEAPVATSASLEAFLTSESADHSQTEQLAEEGNVVPEGFAPTTECTSPVLMPVEDNYTSSTHLRTAEIKSVDCSPSAHYTEDVTITDVDSLLLLIEDAGFSQDPALMQPSHTKSLVWDVVRTAGFALLSVPWLRIGVAAAGIVVDVAATLLRL